MLEAEATFSGQLEIERMQGLQTIIGVCCTRCILDSVYAALGVCCIPCELMMMAWRDREG